MLTVFLKPYRGNRSGPSLWGCLGTNVVTVVVDFELDGILPADLQGFFCGHAHTYPLHSEIHDSPRVLILLATLLFLVTRPFSGRPQGVCMLVFGDVRPSARNACEGFCSVFH